MASNSSGYDDNLTPQELAAAMRADSQGMRDLQQFLEGVQHLDDATFAVATDGTDRGEALVLLDRLKSLLAETDQLLSRIESGDGMGADSPAF